MKLDGSELTSIIDDVGKYLEQFNGYLDIWLKRKRLRMIKTRYAGWLFIIVLAISSCSINLSQSSVQTPESTPDMVATDQIPVTWANLNLTGKLI